MHVIGTAGHVDHGKSALVEALTGVHPDRLKEEQARAMTIDVGFGWLELPNGEQVGIVDVPGHRDFIENMLAGIGGIDAALLVVAADEGVMPQTREHLAILDLLQIPAGLLVLTKTDLAPDPDWLDEMERDLRAAAAGTFLQVAHVVRVSAKTRSGLDELRAALEALLEGAPARADLGRPRLPIDRAFSMSGFGTVVTGTLSDGRLQVEDEVELLPSGARGRVRGLQTHRQKETAAVPGSRTAVNITGVAVEAVRRGDVLTHPGQYQASRRLDARLRLLPDASTAVRHGDELKFYVGASETMARARLLGADELKPGESGWIQLELRDPVVTVRGDRFILRRPSPGETLGGGAIVEPQPRGRHKRFAPEVVRSLESMLQGSPADVLYEAALALNAAPAREVVRRSRLDPVGAAAALEELCRTGRLVLLEQQETPAPDSDAFVIAAPHWHALRERIEGQLGDYHRSHASRRGMPREELKSRLKLQPRVFNAAIEKLSSEAAIVAAGKLLRLPGHAIELDSDQQVKARGLLQKFELHPYSPPALKETRAEAGEALFEALVELGELVPVSEEVVFRKADYDSMVAAVRAAIESNGRITLAEVRDRFDTSRKYAQALLEHLDAIGVTVRNGDYRISKR